MKHCYRVGCKNKLTKVQQKWCCAKCSRLAHSKTGIEKRRITETRIKMAQHYLDRFKSGDIRTWKTFVNKIKDMI